MDGPDLGRRDREAVLLEARTVRDHLEDFALRASRRLGPDTDVSISVRHRGHDRLAASTSERAARCDTAEHDAGSGPCVTAMDTLQVVLVPDLAEEVRWPTWRDAAIAAGYRSAAGVPAHVTEGAEVALNLYSERLDPWDSASLLRADSYAQDVARTVRLCLELAELSEAASHAEQVLDAQAALDRAIASTMTAQGVDAPRALQLLLDAAASRRGDDGPPPPDAAPPAPASPGAVPPQRGEA